MTEYAHITKVFYRPSLSNDFKWEAKEFAIQKVTNTDKSMVVFESHQVSGKIIHRREARHQLKVPAKKLKKGGFLGNMRNRVKLNRFTQALKGVFK